MPKSFKSIDEKRGYERSRKKIQKENGLSNEKKEYIVYSVHLKNCEECCYVGMTTNLSARILKHKSASKREESAFYDYVKEKGGWENFYFNNIIHKEITITSILKYESYFIRFLKPLCNSVRPYISNSEYNIIASELGHPLLPEPAIPEPEIKKFTYRNNNLPKFVGLNPITDEEETRVYTIYKIECAKKKIYIGMTHDPVERFLSHKENSQNRNINDLYDHIYDSGGWANVKITVELNGKMVKKRALLLESFFIRYLKPELNSLLPYICDTDFYRIKKELNLP